MRHLSRLLTLVFLLTIASQISSAPYSVGEIVDHLDRILPFQYTDPNVGRVTILDASGIEPSTVIVRYRMDDRSRGPFSRSELADWRDHAVRQHCAGTDGMIEFNKEWVQRWVDKNNRHVGDIRYSNEDCI